MHPLLKVVASTGVVALSVAWSSGRVGVADAQVGPTVARSSRGGLLAQGVRNQFEVFFYPTGLRLFPLDSAGLPVDASKLSATATFYYPDSPAPWFTRPLHVTAAGAGQAPASLDLVIGLSTVPPKGARVTFEIADLPESGESTVVITVPVEFVASPAATNSVPPPVGAMSSPRYVYGPGYNGLGYYQYTGPQAAPATVSAPTVYSYSTPSGRSPGRTSAGSTRDWTTGHHLPVGGLMSKPWLKPID